MVRYREERRKSFPTAGNVARKAAQAAEREQRGELDPQHGQRMLKLHEVRWAAAELQAAHSSPALTLPAVQDVYAADGVWWCR